MHKYFYFVVTRIGSSTGSVVVEMYFEIITFVRAELRLCVLELKI
jgi:hypothetical protein